PGGCESPVSDFESRTPKGRGKRTSRNSAAASERLPEGRRLRKGRRGTVNSSSSFTAPPSPAKSEAGSGKRKVRGDPDSSTDRSGKRSRSCSRGGGAESPAPTPPASSDAYIVCPEPNCHKKYKHMNGLRYHRTHAHRKSSVTEDGKEDVECDDEEDDKIDKKERTPLSERAERMKAKEKQRLKEQKRGSDRDSKDSLDDDIPLKDLANKVATGARSLEATSGNKDKEDVGKSLDTNSLSSLTANNKIDPHVVLTKTTMHLRTESPSLSCINSTSTKTKETLDVPSMSSPIPLSSGAIAPSPSSSLPTSSSSNSALVSSVPFSSSSIGENGLNQLALSSNNNNSSNNSIPVMTTIKSPITSQVYQISPTGCLGGVTLVSAQTNPSLSLVSAQTFPLTTSTSPGPTTTSTTSILGMSLSAADRVEKQGNHAAGVGSGALRTLSNARPIAPAPMPGFQNVAGSSLKAIQPKPQTGAEYISSPSASLTDLSKDKVKKSKKKRLENKDSSSSSLKGHALNGSDASSRDLDRTTSNHVMKGPSNIPSSDTIDITDPLSTSDAAFRQRLAASPSPDVVGGGPGGGLRPSFLPVTPGNSDLRSAVNDDVHSPAYSDISDANDTGSPPQRESPEKKELSGSSLPIKKENQINGSPHIGPEGGPTSNSLSGHYGGMYYFGGPPGYLPHSLGPQSMSSPSIKKEIVGVDDVTANNADEGSDKKDGARQQQRSSQSPQQMPGGNNNPEMQQNNLYNYYAHIHGVPPAVMHYQYNMTSHPSTPLEHFHQVLAAQQDPLLRQHLIDQHQKQQQQHQQRLIQQQEAINSAASLGGPDASGKRTPSGAVLNNIPGLRPQNEGSSPFDKSMTVQAVDGSNEHKRFSASDDREQALRDKQHENHQILKENIELKSQMGQHQLLLDLQHQQQINYRIMKQQEQQKQPYHPQSQSDMVRAQIFHQQKQKIFDNQRPDMRKLPPELSNSSLGQQLQIKPEDLVSSDMIKKETRPDARFENAMLVDSKRLDIKEEITSASVLDSTKSSRPSSQSGIASGSMTGVLPSSSLSSLPPSLSMSTTPSPSLLNASTPTSLGASAPGPPPPGFPYSPYYTPPGAFRPMQLDPGHPMFRALDPQIIGYASTGHPTNFLQPPQLGYRLPHVDSEIKTPTLDGKVGLGGVALLDSTLDGKSAPGTQGLGVRPTTPLHKIHELQEKGRHPSPGIHSPAPQSKTPLSDGGKSGGESFSSSCSSIPQDKGSNITNSNNNNNNSTSSGSSGKDKQREYASSPPTQRHVHTHHHTHVVGGFPPLYPPDAYSAMFSPAAAAAAAASIGTAAHPFPPAQPPPPAPKS
ncbi:Zinc finger protein, partial [Plakobranchus ocellatus]